MKKFIEMSWDQKDNNPNTVLRTIVNASRSYTGSGIDRHVNQEGIFDFINDCVEVKGYAETFKMLTSSFWGMDTRHFVRENLYPAINDDYSMFLDFMKKVGEEDPDLLKKSIEVWNATSNYDDEKTLDVLRIQLNDVYLSLPNTSPDYIWGANVELIEHYKNSGILNTLNKPNAFKIYCDLVDAHESEQIKKNRVNVHGTNLNIKYLNIALPPNSAILAILSSSSEEIKKEICNLITDNKLDKQNAKYATVYLNSNVKKDVEFDKIARGLFSLEKEFILNVWDDYRVEKTCIYNSTHILFNCIKNKLMKGDNVYPSIYTDKIKSLNDTVSKDYMFSLLSTIYSHLSVSELSQKKEFIDGVVNNIFLTNSKAYDHNKIADFIDELAESDSMKFIAFGIEPNGNESFALKSQALEHFEYIKALEKVKGMVGEHLDVQVKSFSNFLALAKGVNIEDSVKEKLKAMESKVLDNILHESQKEDYLVGKNIINFLALVYQENKEKVNELLTNPKIRSRIIDSDIWNVRKSSGDYDKRNPSFSSYTDDSNVVSLNKEVRKNILEILILDKELQQELKNASRDALKHNMIAYSKEVTEMVKSSPEKFFDVIMKDKKINKIVSDFPSEQYEEIMESFINLNVDKKDKPKSPRPK